MRIAISQADTNDLLVLGVARGVRRKREKE
jgi:hypothetical protein